MIMNKGALLFDDNLMTTARVRSQLQVVDYQVQVLRQLPDDAEAQLIIINLGSRSLGGTELIKSCLQQFPDGRVIGFCGHAEIEIRQAAKQAGLKRILTNDEALQNLVQSLGIETDNVAQET
jgi:DNA-binding NarL/FixJ family response regulator